MKTVKILGDTLNKVADTSTVFDFRLWNGGQAQDVTGKAVSFVIANDSGYLFDVPAVVDGNMISLDFSNELLKQLTPDTYHMEVSVTNADGDVEVYPSEGAIDFTVGKNLHGTKGKLVPQITFDTVLASVDEKITEYTKTIAKGDKGDTGPQGPKGDMDLSQINVGGRNLLLGTRDWTDNTRWNQRNTVTKDTYIGMVIASSSDAWTSPTYSMQYAGILQVGKTYTFSTYVRNTSDTDTQVAPYYEGGIVTPMGATQPLPAHTDWVRVSITFKCVKDPTTSTANLRWEGQNELTNGFIQFAGYKLEIGNVATDWTPAPEDADNTFVKDTRVASGITDFNLVIGKAWSGKWYKLGAHWSNEPAGASAYLQFEYTPGDTDQSGILAIRDWTTNRHWVRTVSAGTWSNWVELTNDASVVHNTGNEVIAGDKTFTGNTAASKLIVYQPTIKTMVVNHSSGLVFNFTRTIDGVVTVTTSTTKPTSNVGPGWLANVAPNGFKPNGNIDIPYIRMLSAQFPFATFAIDGQVYLNNTITPSQAPDITGTYITNDPWNA